MGSPCTCHDDLGLAFPWPYTAAGDQRDVLHLAGWPAAGGLPLLGQVSGQPGSKCLSCIAVSRDGMGGLWGCGTGGHGIYPLSRMEKGTRVVVSWTGKCKRSALEVVVTCSQSIPQAVAQLQVGVIIGCTTMYNQSVTKKGCMRYHWVYEDVCYDVQDRLTWVFDPDSDEKEEAWNYWTIWDDHCSHVGNYSWWGGVLQS